MLKTILKRVREYLTPSLLAPFFVGLESLMECIMPFVISLLINFLQNKSDENEILEKSDMNFLLALH